MSYYFSMHTQFGEEDTLETMSGEWKGFVRAPFTLHASTAGCGLRLPHLGPADAKEAKR